jgi:hypothetical protein
MGRCQLTGTISFGSFAAQPAPPRKRPRSRPRGRRKARSQTTPRCPVGPDNREGRAWQVERSLDDDIMFQRRGCFERDSSRCATSHPAVSKSAFARVACAYRLRNALSQTPVQSGS